jgi:hypothetical protein
VGGTEVRGSEKTDGNQVKLVVVSDPASRSTVSVRNVIPPFEDALAAMPGATLVYGTVGRHPSGRSRLPAWLAAARTVRRADCVLWSQLHLKPELATWALAYARPSAHRAMFALEQWEHEVDSLARIVDAQRMTACFVTYRSAFVELRERYPKLPFFRIAMGFNQSLFKDPDAERDIYVFWMGRRHEPLHRALLEHCGKRRLTYRYSRAPNDPATTAELSRLVARSRYFVVTPPDLDNPRRTGNYSPITCRYLEGPGGGSRLLGVIPGDRAEYDELFPADAMVECAPDGSDIEAVLEAADADPEAESKRIAVRDVMHREHGWDKRAQQVHEELSRLVEEPVA